MTCRPRGELWFAPRLRRAWGENLIIARFLNRRSAACCALLCAFGAQVARAARITIDPDGYAVGADISHAFPEVTFSAFGSGELNGPDVSTPQVFARHSTFASTGNRVFGNSSYSHLWFSDSAEFRVDFARRTNFVSLDLIADDDFDPSALFAYDSTGQLLVEAAVSGMAGVGIPETATISRSQADIAYVVATNPTGMAGQQFLIDRLVYESRPLGALGASAPDRDGLQPRLLDRVSYSTNGVAEPASIVTFTLVSAIALIHELRRRAVR